MFPACLLAVSLAAPVPKAAPFPLRDDPPPKGWKPDEMNDALPYRWEKGTLHVLAWHTVEDTSPWTRTQALVLKKFDQPTEKGGHKWVLATVYHKPDDTDSPWRGRFIHPPPVRPGEQMPKVSDGFAFGHEFYKEPPTDEQVKTFLKDCDWKPFLGESTYHSAGGKRIITTRLTAGGVDRLKWKDLFGRDLPVELFPELMKNEEKR